MTVQYKFITIDINWMNQQLTEDEIIDRVQQSLNNESTYSKNIKDLVRLTISSQINIKIKIIQFVQCILNDDADSLSQQEKYNHYLRKYLALRLIKELMLKGIYSFYIIISIYILPQLIKIVKCQLNSSKKSINMYQKVIIPYCSQLNRVDRDYMNEHMKLGEQIMLFFGGGWPNLSSYFPYGHLRYFNIFFRAIRRIPKMQIIYEQLKVFKRLNYRFKYFGNGDYIFYIKNIQQVLMDEYRKQFLDYLNDQINYLIQSDSYRCFISNIYINQDFYHRLHFLLKIIYTAQSCSIKFIVKTLAKCLHFHYSNIKSYLIICQPNSILNEIAKFCHIIQILDYLIKMCEIETIEEIKYNCIEIIIKFLTINYTSNTNLNQQQFTKISQLYIFITDTLLFWSQCTQLVGLSNFIYILVLQAINKSRQALENDKNKLQLKKCIKNIENLKEINQQKQRYIRRQDYQIYTTLTKQLINNLTSRQRQNTNTPISKSYLDQASKQQKTQLNIRNLTLEVKKDINLSQNTRRLNYQKQTEIEIRNKDYHGYSNKKKDKTVQEKRESTSSINKRIKQSSIRKSFKQLKRAKNKDMNKQYHQNIEAKSTLKLNSDQIYNQSCLRQSFQQNHMITPCLSTSPYKKKLLSLKTLKQRKLSQSQNQLNFQTNLNQTAKKMR